MTQRGIKRKALELYEKLEIITEIGSGSKQSEICAARSLPKQTVNNIWKNKEKIQQAFNTLSGSAKRCKFSKNPELDNQLLKWIKQCCVKNIPLNGPFIKLKAEELAEQLQISDLKFSDGWLQKFKERNGVVWKFKSGESKDANVSLASEWLNKWPVVSIYCMNPSTRDDVTKGAQAAVLGSSSALPGYEDKVAGYDWSQGNNLNAILTSFRTTGFQATNFGLGVEEINKMISARNSKVEDAATGELVQGCTIFLGYTSNLVSSGLRETFRFLAQHKLIDCIVTTAGGIEEDFIKCLGSTLLGDFSLKGAMLREKGINRIGNLLVPNDNYVKFENWVTPILDEMVESGIVWTPSKIIAKLGEKINDQSSIYYWAWKNSIPVFSPALTDGSLGDMMFFHSYRKPGLVVDILGDLKDLNKLAIDAKSTGMIILGGGLVKHHVCNANLMRNGADYSVFINTAQEFDGSDAGARPDEAISWGKIKLTASPVKIYAEATLVFPLLVSQTFANVVDFSIYQKQNMEVEDQNVNKK